MVWFLLVFLCGCLFGFFLWPFILFLETERIFWQAQQEQEALLREKEQWMENNNYDIQYGEPDPSQEVQLPLPFHNRPRESSSSEQKDEEDTMR